MHFEGGAQELMRLASLQLLFPNHLFNQCDDSLRMVNSVSYTLIVGDTQMFLNLRWKAGQCC